MEAIAEKVRPYTHVMHQNLLAWHRYYSGMLQKERDDNLAMRLENDDRMASLGRLNQALGQLRGTLTDGDVSSVGEIAYLKEQLSHYQRAAAGYEADAQVGSGGEG